jgi:bacillolysin/neutral peptidase B
MRSTAATVGPGAARLVSFEQTRANIPVFGSRVTVELDANRRLVSIDATLAKIGAVPHVAALSAEQALGRVAAAANVPVASLKDVHAPNLMFYNDDKSGWHLAYVFLNVAAAPSALSTPDRTAGKPTRGPHGLGLSPREIRPRVNYLIDAHDGSVLLYYCANPMVVLCRGTDDDGKHQRFYGSQVGTLYEMHDSLRSVRTFDLEGADLDGPFPKAAIRSKVSDPWVGPAAVSAHVNAMRVQQFFNDVLGRHGIDDKGMELVSVVNCTYAADQAPPEWHNAIWYDNRMWYGRMQDPAGALRSYSRFLDIIGHELTHGVTEHTASLVYKNQSGALDESVSDIFGVIINNWYAVGPDSDVAGWNWEIGPGLGENGGPLRDMSNPGRTKDPSHMKNYLVTTSDNGGVHTNSNIHNTAAYNLLVATDGGKRAMLPSDVAVLYYLALQRLGQLAGFSDMRRALLSVAKTYFGNPAQRTRMVAHIEAAYDKVAIDK